MEAMPSPSTPTASLDPLAEGRNDDSDPAREGGAAGRMRAACRNRTDDLLITSETLYRLS